MRIGLCLACSAMLLQLAVWMQPILPENIRIALVCQSIATLFIGTVSVSATQAHASEQHAVLQVKDHRQAEHSARDLSSAHIVDQQQTDLVSHQHAAADDCLYCTVYAHLFSGLALSIIQVMRALRVRLLGFKQRFQAVYFALQRLYLSPQGRAPPSLAAVFV